MSKEQYTIKNISKNEAAQILNAYHYLKDISKGFKSGFNYGCFMNEKLVGVIIFTGFPVPELLKGLFGLERNEQNGLFELSRLCLIPDIQQSEHNLASWFVSQSIKLLRIATPVRAILSYADSGFHKGTVYQACNFKYYGLTNEKKDFYFINSDGTTTKHSRGTVKGYNGYWKNRNRKHRYLLCFDKALIPKWEEQKYPN